MASIDPGHSRHQRRPSRGLAFRPALIAGLVGLVLTFLATLHAHRTIQAEEEGRFQGALVAVQEAIDRRMEGYVALLLAGRGLFMASEVIERQEFHEWAASLQLGERFPGIEGIGFAAVVPPGAPEVSFAEGWRSNGPNEPAIMPSDRPLSSTIRFLEPDNAENRALLGHDMLSVPFRRTAMDRSRDTGLPSATEPAALVKEEPQERQAGFSIYIPVYKRDMPIDNVARRRDALVGWVYASFRAQDLLEGIFRRHRPQVHVEAYDGTGPSPDRLLFTTRDSRESIAADARGVRVRTLDIAGRPWTLLFKPSAGVAAHARALPVLVGVAGVLCSVLLFAITWEQSRGRRREWVARAAAERAEAVAKLLADASELLASSLDIVTTMDGLARRLVPFLGEICVVNVIVDGEGLVRRAISVANEERLADVVHIVRRLYPSGSPAVRRVIITGKPEIVPVITEDWLAKAFPDPAGRAMISSFGQRSAAILPLATRDRIHGALLLASGEPHFFRRSRRVLAEEVARRAAQAIQTAWLYRQTQDAVRLRDDFLSIASHELRTPLTTMQAQIQVLRRTLQRPERLEREKLDSKLEVIERQVRRLGRLVTDLLDVARIRTGTFEVRRERFELAELFEEAPARLGDGRDVPPITVEATGEAVGHWDRFRLEQVVLNLLGNAVKYGEGKPIEVQIVPERAGVRFSVRDHGIGIPSEKQAIVFERFARAVSDRNYGGLGLGLFIVREIVHAHGGVVRVDSVPGEGSTFTVDLPWGDEAVQPQLV